ncbi:hypothetical protein D922_01328 [Enterococcus faecalis 06-MB-DW-09]|nr:hypothetical protein D922_01328 [Enterococcus faecalis 06-MB-DW-09]
MVAVSLAAVVFLPLNIRQKSSPCLLFGGNSHFDYTVLME